MAFGTLLALSAIGSGLASAAPVVGRGSGSDDSHSRLELRDRGRRNQVTFRILTGMDGRDDWLIRMRHNGDRIFRGIMTARGDNGHVEIHRRVRDRTGTDRFVARDVDTLTGEVCRAHARI